MKRTAVRTERRIPDLPPYLGWNEQAPQYDRPDIVDRSPGVHAWEVPLADSDGIVIKVLLHYGSDGQLDGILDYFPLGTPMDLPGDVLVLVKPTHRCRGIGTSLLNEARRLWPEINLRDQCFTPMGEALVDHILLLRHLLDDHGWDTNPDGIKGDDFDGLLWSHRDDHEMDPQNYDAAHEALHDQLRLEAR